MWDQPILQTKRVQTTKRGLQKNTNDSDTTIYIPLVLDNTEFVNSLLRVTINSDVLIKLFEGKNYNQYFRSDTAMTADDYVKTFMKLDYTVFDYKIFKLLDSNLFKDKVPDSLKGISNRLASWVAADGPLGDFCGYFIYGSPWAQQYNWYADDNLTCNWGDLSDPGDFGGSGGGDTGGNGNSGNGGYGGVGNGSGGTSGGSGNNGYTPVKSRIDTFPRNPCKVIDSLMTTNNFPLYYKTLRDSVIKNHEKGFLFANPFSLSTVYEEVNGIPGTLSVDMNPSQAIDGAVHNHNNDSIRLNIFSYDDFFMLYTMFKNHQIKDTVTFTFGMVYDSTAYIMMITNPTEFSNFGNKFLNDVESSKIFNNVFYKGYGIKAQRSVLENEKSFLNALQTFKTGLSLFKANDNLTNFKRIRLAYNGTVGNAPCESIPVD